MPVNTDTPYLGLPDMETGRERYRADYARLAAMSDAALKDVWDAVWTTDDPPHEDWIELVYVEMSNRGIPGR